MLRHGLLPADFGQALLPPHLFCRLSSSSEATPHMSWRGRTLKRGRDFVISRKANESVGVLDSTLFKCHLTQRKNKQCLAYLLYPQLPIQSALRQSIQILGALDDVTISNQIENGNQQVQFWSILHRFLRIQAFL
jgi:hypothetical protein